MMGMGDDEYWNQTTVTSGFNFDDDKSFSALGQQLNRTSINLPSSDDGIDSYGVESVDSIDVEVVDWSGSVVQKHGQSQPPVTRHMNVTSHSNMVSQSNSRVASSKTISFKVSESSVKLGSNPSAGPSQAQIGGNFPSSRNQLGLGPSFSPEPSRKLQDNRIAKSDISTVSFGSGGSSYGGEFDSISGNTNKSPKKEMSPADMNRLDSEYKKLKTKFENLRRDRYRAPDVGESVKRLMKGEPVILGLYKSKEDKISLLDHALKSGDGNAITAVVLFLKETFSYSLFTEQLLKKPTAANHYVCYLRDNREYSEMVTVLFSLGRKEEAAMAEFRQACRKLQIGDKVTALKRALQTTFSSDHNLHNESVALTEYINLLERQQPIDHSDEVANKSGKDPRFKMFPKVASLVDQPVLTTLYYCCLYHYELPQNSFASPLSMRQLHKLTDKQFCWIATKALSRQKRWDDIEKLLTIKTMFGMGGPKIKSPIPYDKLLDVMERHGAPQECMVQKKDRVDLQKYIGTLTRHTKEFYYAEAALNNSAYHWKN